MKYLSLSPSNQCSVNCPIFNVDVKLASCVKLRDSVWRGNYPEVRRGCQAAMSDSKCPAAEVVRRIAYGHDNEPDEYGSTEPVTRRFKKNILEKIAPVIVQDRTMDRFAVPDNERALLASASERIRKMAGMAAPDDEAPAEAVRSTKKAIKRALKSDGDQKIKVKTKSKVEEAAATGDLSAAVSE